jgi:hypothetical protein
LVNFISFAFSLVFHVEETARHPHASIYRKRLLQYLYIL